MALRLRFRVRTLLIVAFLCAVGSGWLGFRLRQAKLQRQALAEIHALGGAGVYEEFFDDSAREHMKILPPGMCTALL